MAAGGVLGVFAHVDTTVRAIRDLRAQGFTDFTVYSPVPVEEIEAVLEENRPVSPVRLFTLIGGLTGIITGFGLTIWSALKWGLVTGGKPVVSIPPFVIIAFELGILLGGLSTLLAILVLGKLPALRRSPTYDPRFTVDRFGIAVTCGPERAPAAGRCLSQAGAEEVRQ
ncbi:MAG: putative membrane protein [Candidatus Rokubacteria bacterium CSP1-6]|nr:MAG: putative membrane protein [Candidatus Rokubacteria bacterium CSP1-6]